MLHLIIKFNIILLVMLLDENQLKLKWKKYKSKMYIDLQLFIQ